MPNLPAVASLALPGDGGAGDRAEPASFDGETVARAARLQAAEDNKNEQVKRIFIEAMLEWLRSKLMEQPPATLVTDLCTTARQQMTNRDMCRKDDYPEDGFNEINNAASENLINALSKLNQTQNSLDKKLQTVDDRITAEQIESTTRIDVTHFPQQSFIRQGQFPAAPYTPKLTPEITMQVKRIKTLTEEIFLEAKTSLIEIRDPDSLTLILKFFILEKHLSHNFACPPAHICR